MNTINKSRRIFLIYTLNVFVFFCYQSSFGCTTVLIGKKATKEGCVIFAHNEDMGKEAMGVLKYYMGRKFPSKPMVSIPYIELEQPSETYSFWGSGNAKDIYGFNVSDKLPYNYNHILVGMNENGVTMACNWMNAKEKNLKEIGVRRYAIRQLILERAKTARDAVNIITKLIDEYGQADWGGLTYSLADSNEAWVVETTSCHWVARKIREDEIWTVANRFTITDNYDLRSDGLIDFAFNKNWISSKTKKINFRNTFGKENFNSQNYDIEREKLVQKELTPYKGKIDVKMVMQLLKHRYQYEQDFRPITAEVWRDYCEKNDIKRPLSSCLTQSSFIAVLHKKYKNVGGKMWFSFGSPHVGVYFPIYGRLSKIYSGFDNDNGQDKNSRWWKFRYLQIKIDENYDLFSTDFKKIQDEIQDEIYSQNMDFEDSNTKNLLDWEAHQRDLSKKAIKILSNYK